MTTYCRLIETNDHEGATWNWWLALDGNGFELDRFAEFLQERYADQDEPEFELTDDRLNGEQVDLLCRFAEENYYMTHNKVDGVLWLPDSPDELDEKLYKGGIRDFFTGGAE